MSRVFLKKITKQKKDLAGVERGTEQCKINNTKIWYLGRA